MRKGCFVTDHEWLQVEPLATELAIERCRNDRAFLRSLVREYLGAAEGAREAVLERCARDPAYLDSIVKKYLLSIDERGLLDILRASAGVALVAERLGFDPFDERRRQAYALAHRFINERHQWIVLGVGAVLFCVIGLFPPRQLVRWQKKDWHPCDSGGPYAGQVQCFPPPDEKVEVRFDGFRPAFVDHSAPTPAMKEMKEQVLRQPGDTYVTSRCYWELLLLEWLGLFIAVALVCAFLHDGRSFEQRVLALEDDKVTG